MRRATTAALAVLVVGCASPQQRLASDLCDAVDNNDLQQVEEVRLQAEADAISIRQVEAQARLDCGEEMGAMQRDVDELVDRLRELREELEAEMGR